MCTRLVTFSFVNSTISRCRSFIPPATFLSALFHDSRNWGERKIAKERIVRARNNAHRRGGGGRGRVVEWCLVKEGNLSLSSYSCGIGRRNRRHDDRVCRLRCSRLLSRARERNETRNVEELRKSVFNLRWETAHVVRSTEAKRTVTLSHCGICTIIKYDYFPREMNL